jgi:hypothetical protein
MDGGAHLAREQTADHPERGTGTALPREGKQVHPVQGVAVKSDEIDD